MQRYGQPIHQAGGRGFLEELVLLSRLVDGRFPENRQYALGTVTDRRVDPRVASPVVMPSPGGRVVADDEGVLVVLAVLGNRPNRIFENPRSLAIFCRMALYSNFST